MSAQASEKIWSGIEISKVIAGTLAAVTAAVVGSFLGVAGTLAGAAVASVVGSVGTEIYQRSLHRGAKRLGEFAPSFVKAPAAVGTPPVAAATEEDSPSHTVAPRRNIRWGHVAMAAAALFVLAMGSLTVFELATGKSMASTVGVKSSSETSVGSLFDDGAKQRQAPERPAPSQTPTDQDTSPTPSGETSTAPAPDATTSPAPEATTEPTTDPTADTPQQTPPADTPGQDTPNQDTQDQESQNRDSQDQGGEPEQISPTE